MGRGKASGFDDPVDLPKGWKWVQWRVENADELAVFLEDFVVRMRRAPGDHMLIQSPGDRGMNLQLSPGDVLVIRPAEDESGEQLGVIHSPQAVEYRESEEPHLILPH
jgi:hypothetical protein